MSLFSIVPKDLEVISFDDAKGHAIEILSVYPEFEETIKQLQRDMCELLPIKGGKSKHFVGMTTYQVKFMQVGELILAMVGCLLLERLRGNPIAVEIATDTDAKLHYRRTFVQCFRFYKALVKRTNGTKGKQAGAYTVNANDPWLLPLLKLAESVSN
jgi:hypothetical protein